MAGIASIIPYKIYPYNSGGQKSIALFYQFFSAKREVFLICTSNNSKPAEARYKIAPLLGSSVFRYINPFLFFSLKKFIITNSINVIILEHPYFGWLAYLLKKSLKVKVFVHSHNIEAQRFKTLHKWWWKILWHYEKWTYSVADFNFFIQETDRKYAIQNFRIDINQTDIITYGIAWNKPPDEKEREVAKKDLRDFYGLQQDETLILFNGAFDYKPNRDALEAIIYTINSDLLTIDNFNYKIIICGRHIPVDILNKTFKNVILAGFVQDIETYYKGSDIFINPVDDGGGIKTKLVEALGYNLTSVSTINGAIGIDVEICNGKLLLSDSNNFSGFAAKIIEAKEVQSSIGEAFYNHFYWRNITDKAISIIEEHA
jgi:hypothetical protein